ncbi:MAG: hypothetical protein GC208_09635 [Alphaproteobacteria bacterium]|nr:hypothetical protein [Alphaproteobacteria bacterium]
MTGEPISCSLVHGGQTYGITGWARAGQWTVIAGVATVAPFRVDAGHKACAITQAVAEVARFIAEPDGQTLHDFASTVHVGNGKGSALDVVLAAMTAAEIAIAANAA